VRNVAPSNAITHEEFAPAVVRSAIELWFSVSVWMWRRTECVCFVDLTTVRRTIMFGFSLPVSHEGPVGAGGGEALVPLCVLQRHRAHPNQRLTDAAGGEVPFLTPRENTRLVVAMLRELDRGERFSSEDRKAIVDGERSRTGRLV
jgi:hypothetical protein